MMRRNWFLLLFGFLSGLLLLFVGLPLLSLFAEQSAEELAAAVKDASVLDAFLNSFLLATVATAVAVVLGTPFAYLVARRKLPASRFWQAVVDLPLAVPHSVAGIALLLAFGRDALFGALFADVIGVGFVGTRLAIVAAMLFVSLPYAVSAAREAFESISVRVEQVAASLGAPPAAVFFRVSLPLAKGGVVSGAVLTWARAISEFGAVVILAYHPMTAPVKIWDEFASGTLRRSGAVAALFLLLCLAAFIVMRLLTRSKRDG